MSSARHGEAKMPDETPSASVERELRTKIAAVYVRRNQIASDQLGALISTVQKALSGLGKPTPESEASGHPRSRSGDPFTAIMSFAWNAAGAARCSDAISLPAMA